MVQAPEAPKYSKNSLPWPVVFEDAHHHCHYNILSPDGAALNPEHYSTPLPDDRAPEILGIYAVGRETIPFESGPLNARPEEFVVVAQDRLGENIYLHTPSFSRLAFEHGGQTVFDFHERLAMHDGSFPPIWSFLRESLEVSDSRPLRTRGDYRNRSFLLRLRVPAGATGKFRIEIGDVAGRCVPLNSRRAFHWPTRLCSSSSFCRCHKPRVELRSAS